MPIENARNAFLHPSDEFTPIPFWFWNDELKEEELRRQIHDFRDKGVTGFVIHPRKGLPRSIPYLSDRYMHFVRFAVEEAAALGMQVVYTCRSGAKADCPYTYLSLAELLKTSDFVSLHIPMPADKKPVLGEAQLALMKPTAFLVNTARGGVVDEAALLKALDEDRLAGAALDVFAEEPTANLALCAHPKTVVTPHIGGQTAEAQDRIGDEIAAYAERPISSLRAARIHI